MVFLVDPAEDHRDVVHAAVVQGGFDQCLDGIRNAAAAAQDILDLLHCQHVCQSVAADQILVCVLQQPLDDERLHLHLLRVHAQVLGQPGLAPGNALGLHECFVGMVPGDLHHGAAPQAEDAAVAHITDVYTVPVEVQGGQGGADAAAFQLLLLMADSLVHPAAGVFQKRYRLVREIAAGSEGAHALRRRAGCYFPVVAAAHAIEHCQADAVTGQGFAVQGLRQAYVLLVEADPIKEKIILVIAPDAAHIASAGSFYPAAHFFLPAVSCWAFRRFSRISMGLNSSVR